MLSPKAALARVIASAVTPTFADDVLGWPPPLQSESTLVASQRVLSLVRKVARIAVAVVGLSEAQEANRGDRRPAPQDRLSDSVHSVHHSAIGAENDRMGSIDLRDEAGVVDHRAHGGSVEISVEPVDGVDLGDRVDRNFFYRDAFGQLDQAADVPRVDAVSVGGLPEVVLLSHLVESHSIELSAQMRARRVVPPTAGSSATSSTRSGTMIWGTRPERHRPALIRVIRHLG